MEKKEKKELIKKEVDNINKLISEAKETQNPFNLYSKLCQIACSKNQINIILSQPSLPYNSGGFIKKL